MARTRTRAGDESLGLTDTLVRLAHLVDRVFADVSREHDLTPQQAQLLCLLISGPVGMGELGRLLHLEKSSLSGLVDRVAQRGLAERIPHERDRRACRVALTTAGERAAEDTHDAVATRLDALAGDLPRSQRRAIIAAGARLLAAERGQSSPRPADRPERDAS